MAEPITRLKDPRCIPDAPGLYVCKVDGPDGHPRFIATAIYSPGDDTFEECFETELSATKWLRDEWSCFEGYIHDSKVRQDREAKELEARCREKARIRLESSEPKQPEPPAYSTRESDFQRRDWFTCSTCTYSVGVVGEGWRCTERSRPIRWNPDCFGCGRYGAKSDDDILLDRLRAGAADDAEFNRLKTSMSANGQSPLEMWI